MKSKLGLWSCGLVLSFGLALGAWAGLGDPQGMVLVPAGKFLMGDSFGEGSADELPVHEVYVSAFWIDIYEVTKALWDEVASWAANHGYDIGPSDASGNAPDHPVYNVTWYEVVKWANARSEREGLTPCYYTDATHRAVYRRDRLDLTNDCVKWTANGYRLPTEAEWEKAARGGCEARRFPWCDTNTITHTRANYVSSYDYSADISLTRGYHPAYTTGSEPYTSPVGRFIPNGYNLYDMAGNLWEWCWDWYSSVYYSTSPSADPRGPSWGSSRVTRGGSWGSSAVNCRVARRGIQWPGHGYRALGFRLVRGAQ